jgi:hypothetical protein
MADVIEKATGNLMPIPDISKESHKSKLQNSTVGIRKRSFHIVYNY